MGEYIITDPNSGKKYKVTGDTPEGAVGALKKMLSGSQPEGDVIFRTEDGGRVTKSADGKLAFHSDVWATNDQAAVREILNGAKPSDISMRSQDNVTLSQHPYAAGAAKFLQGIPFVGQYVDEAFGAVQGDKTQEAIRASQSAMDRQYPKTSAGLQVAGGITGSAAAAAALPEAATGFVARHIPKTLIGQAATGVGFGATTGAIEGGISGYGAGNDGDRVQSAKDFAAIGGALGGVIGGAAPLASAGIKKIAQTLRGTDVSAISRELGISAKAAKVVKASIEHDDLAAAEAAIKAAGPDGMIADAGPAGARLLDTATKSSGAAARVAKDAIEPRVSAANTKLAATMDAVLGKPEGVRAATSEVATRTAAARKAAYDMAFNSPIDYSTGGAGDAILGVLDRVPSATLKSAISEANDAMKAAGVKNMQIMASIAEDGTVTFKEMPNVQQLDEIKKALDGIGRNETDAITGRISAQGLRAKGLAKDLRGAISDAVPGYKTAVKLGGDKIAEQDALTLGRKLLSPATTREDVALALDGASKEELSALKRGLRSQIDETLANVKRTISDPNTDAREAMKVVKDMSSRANAEKLTALLGKADADKLFAQLDEAAAALDLRSATARNSDTYSRMATDNMVQAVTPTEGRVGKIFSGTLLNAGKEIVDLLIGKTGERAALERQQIYKEIAQALTTKRGPDAAAALKIIDKAIQGQPVSSAEAARIAHVLTSGLALTGYQSGKQYLTRR